MSSPQNFWSLVIESNTNLSTTMKRFCKCNWSPKSVGFKIFGGVWPNNISLFKAELILWLVAEEEVRYIWSIRGIQCSWGSLLLRWSHGVKHWKQPLKAESNSWQAFRIKKIFWSYNIKELNSVNSKNNFVSIFSPEPEDENSTQLRP